MLILKKILVFTLSRKKKKCRFTHADSILNFKVDEHNLTQLQVIIQQNFSLVSPEEKLRQATSESQNSSDKTNSERSKATTIM